MKKLLLTLGATASVVAPMATVVACGDKAEAPVVVDSSDQAWEDFTMDYTIDPRTNALVRTDVEFEINITGFDKEELLELSSKDVLIGSMHLMNQIVKIVEDNRDKDITGITVNGKRIDDQVNNPDRDYYGLTFAEMVDLGVRWYQGVDIASAMNVAIGHRNGGKVMNPISQSTITFLDAFWKDFVISLEIEDAIATIESTSTLEDVGARVEGSKIFIDADHLAINDLPSKGFSDPHTASRVAGSGSILNGMLRNIDVADINRITSIVFETDNGSKEIEFTDVFGEATLSNYVAANDWDTGTEDYPAVLSIDPTDAVYDSYFNALKYFEQDDDDYSVDGTRAGTENTIEYQEKSNMLMFKLIMEFHA